MSEYPKLLWLPDGRELTVADADEEARKRAEGCVGHGEQPAAAPEAVPETAVEPEPESEMDEDAEGPTFGPPDDDTHAKRSKKK